MVSAAADAPKLKFAEGVTSSVTVIEFVTPAAAPVTVTGNAPVIAPASAVKVSALLDEAGFGLKEAITPPGRPDVDKLTVPLKPLNGVMVIVVEPVAPCATLTLFGDAERLKLEVGAEIGQLFTKFAALTVPIPVAKSHPVDVP